MVRRVRYENGTFKLETGDKSGDFKEINDPNNNKQAIADGYLRENNKIFRKGKDGGKGNQVGENGDEYNALKNLNILNLIKQTEGGKKPEEQKDLGAPNEIKFENGKIKGIWQKGGNRNEHILYGKELENFFDKYVGKEQEIFGSRKYKYYYLNNIREWEPIQDTDKLVLLKEAALVNKKIPILYQNYLIDDENAIELTPHHKLNGIQYYISKTGTIYTLINGYPRRVNDQSILTELRNYTNKIEEQLKQQEKEQKQIEALQKTILTVEERFTKSIDPIESVKNGRFTDTSGNILNDNQSVQVLLNRYVKERNSYNDFFKYYQVNYPLPPPPGSVSSSSSSFAPTYTLVSPDLTSLIMKEENRLNIQVPLKYTPTQIDGYNVGLTPYHKYNGEQYYKEETRGDIYINENGNYRRLTISEIRPIQRDIYRIERIQEEEKRQLQLPSYKQLESTNYSDEYYDEDFDIKLNPTETKKQDRFIDDYGSRLKDNQIRSLLTNQFTKQRFVYDGPYYYYYKNSATPDKAIEPWLMRIVVREEKRLNVQIPLHYAEYTDSNDKYNSIYLTGYYNLNNTQYLKDIDEKIYKLEDSGPGKLTAISATLNEIKRINQDKLIQQRQLERQQLQSNIAIDLVEPINEDESIKNKKLSDSFGIPFTDDDVVKILTRGFLKERKNYEKFYDYYNIKERGYTNGDPPRYENGSQPVSPDLAKIILNEETRLNIQVPVRYLPYNTVNGYIVNLTPFHQLPILGYLYNTVKQYYNDIQGGIYELDSNGRAYAVPNNSIELKKLEDSIIQIDINKSNNNIIYQQKAARQEITKQSLEEVPFVLIDGIQYYKDKYDRIYYYDEIINERRILNFEDKQKLKVKIERDKLLKKDRENLEQARIDQLKDIEMTEQAERTRKIEQEINERKKELKKKEYLKKINKLEQEFKEALYGYSNGPDLNITRTLSRTPSRSLSRSRTPSRSPSRTPTRTESTNIAPLISDRCPIIGTVGSILKNQNISGYLFAYKDINRTKYLFIRPDSINRLEAKSYSSNKTGENSCNPKIFINFADNEMKFGILVLEDQAESYPNYITDKYRISTSGFISYVPYLGY